MRFQNTTATWASRAFSCRFRRKSAKGRSASSWIAFSPSVPSVGSKRAHSCHSCDSEEWNAILQAVMPRRFTGESWFCDRRSHETRFLSAWRPLSCRGDILECKLRGVKQFSLAALRFRIRFSMIWLVNYRAIESPRSRIKVMLP